MSTSPSFLTKILLGLFTALLCQVTSAQDSLSTKQLEPLTHYFDIEANELIGEGTEFLKKILSDAQFTMIGEYHGSARISELTQALIPLLDEAGYKRMALEVGPITGRLLNQMDTNALEALKEINNTYLIREEDGYVNAPIPFFEFTEDALFLVEAKKRGWEVFGIDQEFLYGYPMLLDQMYANLPDTSKGIVKQLYDSAKDSLNVFYRSDIDGSRDLAESIRKSIAIKSFTDKASMAPSNSGLINALYDSNHIYWLYSQGKWFENNSERIRYMKARLREGLEASGFALESDKLLIKMGGYHMSKGFSPLGLYEVGNTLNELAEFYGNKAISIGFSMRFYEEDGEVKDMLQSENAYRQRYRDLNQMGRKDEWAVIDLRPMIKGHFYRPVKYSFNEHIEELIKRFDLLIIPKMEVDPTPNYSFE